MIKLAGLPEQEASDWAYLTAEIINWEWILQILKAAEWKGTPQEAIEIIRAAVIVDEGIKVTVEAEKREITGRERQMRTIEQFQIRKIYAIGNALGIKASGSEDELHALVGGVTGKDSIKSLTYQEACAVIARLEELQGKTVSPKPRNSKPKEHETRPGGVTSGQQKKIWFLMYELKKCDEVPNDVQLGDRLCAVIKKEFGADAVARNPFAWITFEQGNNLIEILKRYVASARKRGEA